MFHLLKMQIANTSFFVLSQGQTIMKNLIFPLYNDLIFSNKYILFFITIGGKFYCVISTYI